jgi:hypothetical protein
MLTVIQIIMQYFTTDPWQELYPIRGLLICAVDHILNKTFPRGKEKTGKAGKRLK